MRKNRFMLAAIFLLGIGFAAVTTTLLMTGNVKIATNDRDFDVVFTKAVIDGTDTPSAITDGGKTITFGTKNLITVGDISKLDFEVTNNSELYDAEVSIECSTTGPKKSYYSIAKEVATPIAAKTTGTGKVEVTLNKAPDTNIHEDFTCTLTATAAERTEKAEKPKYTPRYFAFGTPTTSSTQDYKTLGTSVFVGLDSDERQKSVCTLATGSIECFRGGATTYVTEEQKHLKEVFAEGSCTSDGSDVICSLGTFHCQVYSSGSVNCTDSDAPFYCYLDYYGSVYCTDSRPA